MWYICLNVSKNPNYNRIYQMSADSFDMSQNEKNLNKNMYAQTAYWIKAQKVTTQRTKVVYIYAQ